MLTQQEVLRAGEVLMRQVFPGAAPAADALRGLRRSGGAQFPPLSIPRQSPVIQRLRHGDIGGFSIHVLERWAAMVSILHHILIELLGGSSLIIDMIIFSALVYALLVPHDTSRRIHA